MQSAEEILKMSLDLPLEQRAELAQRLLHTLEDDFVDPDWEKAWREELARRLDKLDRGEAQLIPWTEAYATLQAQLRMKKFPTQPQE